MSIFAGPYAILIKIGIALLLLVGFGWYCYDAGYDKMALKHQAFVSSVEALGAKAEADRVVIEAKNKQDKDKADEENRSTIASLNRTVAGLRKQRASTSLLPSRAPDATGSTGTTCYDNTEHERALRKFYDGVSGLAEEGDKAQIDLNTAKKWAK